MPAREVPKGLSSFKPADAKKPGQPRSPNLDAAEKAQSLQRITSDGPEKPKESPTMQKVAFRTFIQPYGKRHGSCKVIAIIIAALAMVTLIIVLLIFCGVFQVQEAKEHAGSHVTGEVLANSSLPHTARLG